MFVGEVKYPVCEMCPTNQTCDSDRLGESRRDGPSKRPRDLQQRVNWWVAVARAGLVYTLECFPLANCGGELDLTLARRLSRQK